MKHIGARQTQDVLDRLARAIRRGDKSLRGICAETMTLDPPERIHHAQLSVILRGGDHRNLYLQQLIVLCKLVGMPPAALFLPTDDLDQAEAIAKAATRLARMPEAQRHHLLGLIDSVASGSR